MIYKAAIFDMDGTLVDTLEDLADSVNEMLAIYNFPQRTLEEVRNFVGSGAKKLLERALPAEKSADKNFLDKALATYDECYSRHLLNKSKPYAGIMELLTHLQAKNIPLGICTNKQNFAAQIIAEKILSPIKFQKVFGDGSVTLHPVDAPRVFDKKNIITAFKGENSTEVVIKYPRKPNPTCVLEIAKNFSVKPEEVAYFGDTAVDMQTANNAGFLAVGVSWGFRPEELQESGAKIIIDKPADILKLIDFA